VSEQLQETTQETPAETPAAETPAAEAPAAEEQWAGPSREEWEAVQQRAARADELYDLLNSAPPAAQPEQPVEQTLPEYDPFDPESAAAYLEAREQRQLERLAGLLDQRLGPITNEYQTRAAEQWVDTTFPRLGVPEGEHWKEGVLFTAAAFQPLDQHGRPTVPPEQAARQGLEFLRKFAEAERAAEREKLTQEQTQSQEALQNRAAAPTLPTGAAGAEGVREVQSLEEATRRWLEEDAARSAA
jgi:hypothetical protein